MNKNVARLSAISQKNERLIIGLMSGTSLDGLDVALCRFTGSGRQTKVDLLKFETLSYTKEYTDEIRAIFSKRQVDLEKVCLLNDLTGSLYADMILDCLKRWKVSSEDIDCIASHGQSIYHAPMRLHNLKGYPNATLQIGDGDHIARKTGIIALSDFRQKHIAAGGEGAPLALYGDYILFSSERENRVLLNIGGIANFTFLPVDGDASKIVCTDTGPGNTLIDILSQKYFNAPFDKDGLIAAKGNVNEKLLNAMLMHPFFQESLPKTSGPELFNMNFIETVKKQAGIADISPEDLIATATKLSAEGIIKAMKAYIDLEISIYSSGGGSHNPIIMNYLKVAFKNSRIGTTNDLGINPDAKEAILFAILANETLSDSSMEIGGLPATAMGKISLPY